MPENYFTCGWQHPVVMMTNYTLQKLQKNLVGNGPKPAPVQMSSLCTSSINHKVQVAVAPNASQCLCISIPSIPRCISNAKRQPILQQAMFLNSVHAKNKV